MVLDTNKSILGVSGGYGFIFGLLRYFITKDAGTITKCNSYFIIKYGKNLLQNASGFSLQNASVYGFIPSQL